MCQVVLFVLGSAGIATAQYNIDYFLWRGRQELSADGFHQAISTFNTLLRVNDKAYEAYFMRGIAKYNLDDLIGAEADFSRAILLNPVYTTAYTYRAITASRLGNYNDALNDFKQAIELRPDLPSPYYSRAITRLLNGQYDLAIEDFDQFIIHERKVSDAYLNRGLCYLNLKDTVRAFEDFDRAVGVNRYDTDSYNRRGALYMSQGRYNEAEADFDRAIENDTNDLISYFNRSLLYNQTKRPTLSLADLDRVIEIDSTNSISYFNRAIVRSQVGDYNRALEDYDRVANYSPNNVLVYFYRANLLSQLGEVERAEDDYSRAIKLYPDFANAYINRAHIRSLLGNNSGAKHDRELAESKIEEHKAKLADSTYSIYSDSTYRFDRLLAFDTKLTGSTFNRIDSEGISSEQELIPLYKFNIGVIDTIATDARAGRYYAARMSSFIDSFVESSITLSHRPSALSIDSLTRIDSAFAEREKSEVESWQGAFARGVSLSLIKQYTSSIASLTSAIDLSPGNPFLYLERAAVRAEMIDFISSIDNSYQRIAIENDPANSLKGGSRRNFNYNEALADLDMAAKLYPDLAYTYYNRANLLAQSGKLPEAYNDYTRAIELHSSFAEAYYNRGVVQMMMNDSNKGIIDISKAGELGVERAYELLREYNSKR